MPFITARVVSVVRADAIAAAAFAGDNQSVLCASVIQLEGEIIGDDVANHTFEWVQTFGTPVTLINPNTLTPSFVNPQVSDLEFTFYLDRNTPYEDSDVVVVSRAPTDFMSGALGAGTSGTMGIAGVGVAGTARAGMTVSTELINDAHVSGWAFTNPPTARYSPIFKASDLDRVRENLNGSYWLMNDIDLSEYDNWNPIGTAGRPFTGELQGNGFVIDNMTITDNVSSVGVFGFVNNGALIENLGVTNANVTGQTSAFYSSILAGSLTGAASNDGGPVTIRNCYTTGTIDAEGNRAGGFVGITGTNASTIFENNYADVTIIDGGGTAVGAWCGIFFNNGTYTENYANTTKFSPVHGTVGDVAGATEVSGLTTAQLTAEANYTGWDFTSTWEIVEGVSPATLQQDTSYVRATAECDDQWMVIWDKPTVPSAISYGPTYTYTGAIIEEALSNGNWGYKRFIPVNRAGGLMTPATTHRITSVWDYTPDAPNVGQTSPIEEIQVINDEKFISKETSPSFGPYGNDAIGGALGSGIVALTENTVITIANPRKISMAQSETGTFGDAGTAATAPNVYVLRTQGRSLPLFTDIMNHGTGGTEAYAENIVITRLSGISIG